MAEVVELLEAAEAKAYYGLAINWAALAALTEALLERGVLQGAEVGAVLEAAGVIHLPDPYTRGFGWDAAGELAYPFKQERPPGAAGPGGADGPRLNKAELAGVAATTRGAGTAGDAPRGKDGKYAADWHWSSPYAVERDLPEWFMKEVERYSP